MEFNYYYGSEADQFSFVRIPKAMLTEEMFSPLSLQAKVLDGVLLDRMCLSMRNGWLDKENKVYIIYQIAEIQDDLGFTKKKAMDYLNELEKFGLVEKKRRGLGLPSILYIKSFLVEKGKKKNMNAEDNKEEYDENGTSRSSDLGTSEQDKIEIQNENNIDLEKNDAISTVKGTENSVKIKKERKLEQENLRSISRSNDLGTSRSNEMGTSRGAENALQEVPIGAPPINNTKVNNTDLNKSKSYPIVSNTDENRLDEIQAYESILKDNMEYDLMMERYPYDQEMLQGILDLLLETMLSQNSQIIIASNKYPIALVKSKFMKLDSSHIQYVMDSLNKNTSKVKNIKKYLLATLFNAPTTIKGYYQAEVNHDLPQYAGR